MTVRRYGTTRLTAADEDTVRCVAGVHTDPRSGHGEKQCPWERGKGRDGLWCGRHADNPHLESEDSERVKRALRCAAGHDWRLWNAHARHEPERVAVVWECRVCWRRGLRLLKGDVLAPTHQSMEGKWSRIEG